MKSIVSLLYSATAAQNPVPKSAEDLNHYCGYDMKKILKNIIEDLEELSLEISVKPRIKNDLPSKRHCNTFSVDFNLKEEFPYFFINTCLDEIQDDKNFSKNEQLCKLLDRLETLQVSYSLLLDKVSKTMENLSALYDPKEYNIFVRKKTTKLDLLGKTSAMNQKSKERGTTNENIKETHSTQSGLERADGGGKMTANNLETSGENIAVSLKRVLNKKETGQKNPTMLEQIMSEQENGQMNPIALEVSKNNRSVPKKRKLSQIRPETNKKHNTNEYPIVAEDFMIIGPNGTTIQKKHYEGLQLKGAPGATRFLCDVIFGDDVLATHSLTGNQSPAFRGRERPHKRQLDPLKTADITHLICSKFNVSQQLVRSTITTKCADATKKLKRILSKTM